MKENELRIGNYVTHIDRIVRITEIMNYRAFVDGGGVNIKYDELFPIEITEKLLKELGFTQIAYPIGYVFKYEKEIDLDGNKGLVIYGKKSDGFNYIEISMINIDSGKETHFKTFDKVFYFHQLQNFYYITTQKELEFEL